ncbi:MAG TPA: hypothetical protein EYN66_16630, partial [Myxococcales bacterium]|nr:hypothetical protein [Myxococcales bacterium]
MATIQQLRDTVVSTAGGDRQALNALEEACIESADLTLLFEAYRDAAGAVQDVESLGQLSQRFADLLDDLIARERISAKRSQLRQRRGDLHAQGNDYSSALDLWCVAFDELPSDDLLQRIDALMTRESAPELNEAMLGMRMQLVDDAELRLTIARRMGVLQMTRRELDGAQDSFQKVLEIDPDDAAAQEALESIAGIREDQQRMLEDLRAEVKDAPSDRARAAALLTLAETLLDQSSDREEPEQLLEEALDTDASNSGVAATLIECYVQNQAWEKLNSVGARWLDASDTADHFEIFKQIGLALMSDSSNREPAVVQLLAAQKMRPADVDVVHALDGCLTLLERSEELLEVLRAARRCSTVREQERMWLVREAEVVWRSQDDIVAAEKLFRRIRAVDPRNLTALLFYEDYLGRKEDWKRLYAVLNQRFALVEFDQRIDVAVKMAELAEFQMGNPDKAIDAYKRVLADEATNERASDALIQLFEKTDKWHALIEFLNARVRTLPAEATDAKTALLFRIIEVYQDDSRLPVEEMVIHTYNRIVQISPSNVRALDSLAQRYEDTERWSELVNVLQKKIVATVDAEELVELFHQVADLYISRMSSENHAIPFLERILEIDPSNLDVVRTLRAIYKGKHDLERLYQTYETELDVLSGSDREPVLLELAVLAG